MAVINYKFKSAKDFSSISIDGNSISVGDLKERIFELKRLGRGTDYDLLVTNAQTNEEYVDESIMIPSNSSVLIRRVPGLPRMPIVVGNPKVAEVVDDQSSNNNSVTASDSSVSDDVPVSDLDYDLGDDLYAVVTPEQAKNVVQDTAPLSRAEEDAKIQELVANSGLDWGRKSGDASVLKRKRVCGDAFVWKRQCGDGCALNRQSRDGLGKGGQGLGRGGAGAGLGRNRPPPGYICRRCKVPGHLIQHCPTNGDPDYDIKRVKPPTGIPKSMLVPTPDGFYVMPSGTSAVLKPNEAAFDKEMEGLTSTRPVHDVPAELHCPMCKQVMKDAVLTSKCCLDSFCDKCIRDYIMSKRMCVCGVRDVLADSLVPNKTVRDTINRVLECGYSSSAGSAGSATHVQKRNLESGNSSSADTAGSATNDMEPARRPPSKVASPIQSAALKGAEKSQDMVQSKFVDAPQLRVQPQTSDREKMTKFPEPFKATHESVSIKERASHGSALPIEEERVPAGDSGKMKRKKAPLPMNAADMKWMSLQGSMNGYDMGLSDFNPYWQGMLPPTDRCMGPFTGNLPYDMNSGIGPMNIMFPHMLPLFCQRDLAAGMGMNFKKSRVV